MRAATPLERNDIISRWTGDCPLTKPETPEESALRLANFMAILDDVPADILNEAFKRARRATRYMPEPGDVYAIASPLMKERLTGLRIDREAAAATESRALPPPVYVDLTKEENRRVLDEMYAAMNAAQAKETGMTATPRPRVNALAPLNAHPTAEQLAAVAADFAKVPRRERMTLTTDDLSTLGIATPTQRMAG